MEYKLIENADNNRFEMHIDGFKPYIEYTVEQNKIYLTPCILITNQEERKTGGT